MIKYQDQILTLEMAAFWRWCRSCISVYFHLHDLLVSLFWDSKCVPSSLFRWWGRRCTWIEQNNKIPQRKLRDRLKLTEFYDASLLSFTEVDPSLFFLTVLLSIVIFCHLVILRHYFSKFVFFLNQKRRILELSFQP